MSKPIRVSARAVITQNDRILLVEFNDETGLHYNLPGGGVEIGESVREGAIREVKEETSLDIDAHDLLCAVEYEPKRNSYWAGDRHQLALIFRCTPRPYSEATMPTSPDPNQTAVKWVKIADLPKIELLPHISSFLLKYVKTGRFETIFLEEPVDPVKATKYLT